MENFSLNFGGRLVRYRRPAVMGILNVTPDSFYASSRAFETDQARRRVERMVAEGADIIDVGGYSTRPGAADVGPDEETERLARGVAAAKDVAPEVPVSVDTFRASVARAAVREMGADMVNDISGGLADPDMFATIADLRVPYVLMHTRGTPQTMQGLAQYRDVTADVVRELSGRVRELSLLGVADVIIDPGFGFAKTLEQNYALLRNLPVVADAFPGRPLLVGVSRKSMVTKLLGVGADDALAGTIALDALALTLGARMLRVHDVSQAVQTVRIAEQVLL